MSVAEINEKYNKLNLCIAYPNRGNYSETFIYNHIKYLHPKISIHEGFYPAKEENKSILIFPFNYLFIRGSFRNIIPKIYHNIYTNLFCKFLKRNKIDIVLAEYGLMGVSLWEACKKANIPIIVHFHGFDAYEYATIEKFKFKYKEMFGNVSVIIAVSNDMRQQLISLGAPEDKVLYNPYGVDLGKFSGANPESSDPLLVYVGRFTEKKAPYITIKAFYEALKKCPDAKLIMVGGGELLKSCKELVNELNISNNVEFRGIQSPEIISEILKKGRAFVQHSKRSIGGDSEGTPNTILEASAAGLPIVSTFHAGIKDAVVHNETGFLVEEGEVNDMATYMVKLLKDPELAGIMGAKARKYIEKNFSMDFRIGKLKELIAMNSVK